MDTKLYDYIVSKQHHQFRKEYIEYEHLAEVFASESLQPIERMTRRFELLSRLETPVILEGEKI